MPYSQHYLQVVVVLSRLLASMASKKYEQKIEKSKVEQFVAIKEIE